MRADAHKLVHRTERSHNGPLFDGHMAGDRRAIHQHAMVANHAIVPDVRVGHDEDVAANLGEPSALHCSPVDGHVLADLVMVTNFQTGRLAVIGDILRRHANRTERKEGIVRTNFGRPLNRDVREQAAVLAEVYIGAHHAVRTNRARSGNFRSCCNDGRGMNIHEGFSELPRYANASSGPLPLQPRPRELSTSWHETIASATRLSPTQA